MRYLLQNACSSRITVFLLLLALLQMSRSALNAGATTRLTGVNGQQVAYFDNNGDIYLKGILRQNVIVTALPTQAKWWIKDGANIIALVALETMTVNVSGTPSQITLNAGDMIVRGALMNVTQIHTAKWTLSDGSTQLCHFDASGNLYLKNPPSGQTLADKIHENTDEFAIMQARIISPPFTYHPSEALNMVTRGAVYDVNDVFVTTNPPPNTNLAPDPNYRYMNTAVGDGDNWTMTYLGDDAYNNPILILGNTDGHGLEHKVECAGQAYIPSPPLYESCFGWPDGEGKTVIPNIAINRLVGRPGNFNDMKLKYTGTKPNETMESDSPAVTLARFLDFGRLTEFGCSETSFGLGYNVTAYYCEKFVNPNSLLGVKDRMGNLTLYMAVSEFDQARELTSKINKCYILTSKADSSHAIGEVWQPTTANPVNTHLINCQPPDTDDAMVWPASSNEKFKIPIFIQFGKGYEDYKYAPLEENAQKIWDQSTDGGYYIYAISQRGDRYFFTSELFLGRVKVRHGYPEDVWRNHGADWEYWAGTDKAGHQIWVSDPKDAVDILYAYNELGWPSIMYHKPSNRFLMATFTASDKGTWNGRAIFGPESYKKEPLGARFDTRWFLWEAPYPWGPWKKILSNDYHGRQNDVTGLTPLHGDEYNHGRLYGYSGYTVQLVPAWMENNVADGGWNIWAIISGFRDFTASDQFIKNIQWCERKSYDFGLLKIGSLKFFVGNFWVVLGRAIVPEGAGRVKDKPLRGAATPHP